MAAGCFLAATGAELTIFTPENRALRPKNG
jgi:hypothetical protein